MPPPPGYEPFLHAICDNPDDDTVRLVYADWLDENGDPDRAEFIRIQIEHARTAFHETVKATVAPKASKLWKRNYTTWVNELLAPPGINWRGWRRGFRDEIRVNSGHPLSAHAEALFTAAPIQSIMASGATDEYVRELVALPRLEQVRELAFVACDLSNASWALFSGCPRLANLQRLTICFTGPASHRVAARLHADRLTLTALGASALADSPFLANVESFVVRGFLQPTVVSILKRRFPTFEHHLV